MKVEIIRNYGLTREVWEFWLNTENSCLPSCIYLDSYLIQDRASGRHKWTTQKIWTRIMQRDNTLKEPSLPADVEAEMRSRFQELILTLKVKSRV